MSQATRKLKIETVLMDVDGTMTSVMPAPAGPQVSPLDHLANLLVAGRGLSRETALALASQIGSDYGGVLAGDKRGGRRELTK